MAYRRITSSGGQQIDNVLSGRKLDVMTVQSPRLPILFAAALSYGQR